MQTAPTTFFSSADSTRVDCDLPPRRELSEIFQGYKQIFERAADHLMEITHDEFQRPTLRRG